MVDDEVRQTAGHPIVSGVYEHNHVSKPPPPLPSGMEQRKMEGQGQGASDIVTDDAPEEHDDSDIMAVDPGDIIDSQEAEVIKDDSGEAEAPQEEKRPVKDVLSSLKRRSDGAGFLNTGTKTSWSKKPGVGGEGKSLNSLLANLRDKRTDSVQESQVRDTIRSEPSGELLKAVERALDDEEQE